MEGSKLSGLHILITGGTGLIGAALANSMLGHGHNITILSRSTSVPDGLENLNVSIIQHLNQLDQMPAVDAVVNLAGAQIVGKRWSAKRKREIVQSRVETTTALVQWIREQKDKPEVLISSSAVGYYGDRGERELTESNCSGADFGASLCLAWETEAVKAEQLNVRVCLIRTGLVLSTNGGMLQQLLLPFKFYLGSQIGNGRQWMSWIHIEDQIAAIEKLIIDKRCNGPYNLTAPFPVRNKEFTKTLARVLGRFSFMVTPAWLIKLALGESAELLLGGQKVLPQRLQQSGYAFQFGSLEGALKNLLLKNSNG
jgi:uncharacterized protein (TIGR01777 family)